ncbi:CLUMA_CG006501, isoform A [Clunio marinus]|uniref:CLUMA_CG006501, isoform A n=1 Tax=Clunio marinus TaxID=568069 RepID=A0A1J1I2D5_9DIPT|nr:CLUMA_CG006501, isoform A [Clunio marinus]
MECTMEGTNNFDCCFEEEVNVENAIMQNGVSFIVNYIGCVEIFTSMKLLDFQSRSLVAKECINRVCDAANLNSPKKRRVEKRVQQCISTVPCMEHSGTSVVLNISSQSLQLTSVAKNEIVAPHEMPNISFASTDSESSIYVAYVAKDGMEWRACYVLECGVDKAQTVISTMGQAFELRYKNFCIDDPDKKQTLRSRKDNKIFNSKTVKSDTEYYNDLPGKMPPEFRKATNSSFDTQRERLSSNLIDLNTSIDQQDICMNESKNLSENSACGGSCNSSSINNTALMGSEVLRDVFDMQCFSLSPEVQHSQLLLENWFHGNISRAISESLLRNDGDFLVRDSQGSAGVVRTKDRVFENITHLINYHWSNRLPIISADSALLLQTPVIRTKDLRK